MDNPSLPETPNEAPNETPLASSHTNRLPDQVEDEEQNAELFSAAFEGDEDAVKYLLAQGANPSSTNNSRTGSCLHAAAQNGHEVVVRILLEHGANASSRAPKDWTVLHSASLNGGEGIIRLLVDHGAAVSAKSSTGETPLHIAALQGHEVAVQLLLDIGADTSCSTKHGRTPLHAAAQKGHENIVRALLDRGANISLTGDEEATPLYLAAGLNNRAVVKLLLDRGSDVSSVTTSGGTALHISAQEGHPDIIEMLVEKGANILAQDKWGNTALHLASKLGHDLSVKRLLGRCVEMSLKSCVISFPTESEDNHITGLQAKFLSIKSAKGKTALHLAAEHGMIGVVEILLEHRADILSTASDGWTALMAAAEGGHEDVVRLLLEYGSEISSIAEEGWTALLAAATYGHGAVVCILLEHGADASLISENGRSALIAGAEHGHQEVVEILLQQDGGNLDLAGVALLLAAKNGHERVVKSLLNAGADNSLRTEGGGTALHIAAERGHTSIVKLLLNSGLESSAESQGLTPLHVAALGGHEACTRVLLERELHTNDRNEENVDGKTAVHIAAEKVHEATAGLFLENRLDDSALNPDEVQFSGNCRPYNYNNLLPGWIRLVALTAKQDRQTDDVVFMHIISAPLASVAGKYTALSYMWGDPTPIRHVFCVVGEVELPDGRRALHTKAISVTRNLHDALKALRPKKGVRLLWADQITIDQTDMEEKSAQVQMMGDIFGSASSVFVWLSQEIWANEHLLEHIDSVHAFWTDQKDQGFVEADERVIHGKIVHRESMDAGAAIPSTTWKAVVHLLTYRYFRRVWMIQEIARARDCTVLCSLRGITWDSLESIQSCVSAFHPPDEYKEAFYRYAYHIKEMINIRKEFVPRHKSVTEGGSQLDGRWSLLRLLWKTWNFEATDARDKAYAVLGLLDNPEVGAFKPPLKPDYSISMDALIASVFIRSFTEEGELFPLTYCRPSSNPDLPSWLPEHDKALVRPYQWTVHDRKFRAGKDSSVQVTPLPDHALAAVFRIRRIAVVEDLAEEGGMTWDEKVQRLAGAQTMEFKWYSGTTGVILDDCFRTAFRPEEVSRESMLSFARVMTFDINPFGENRGTRLSRLEDIERVLFCVEEFLAGREEELDRPMLSTFMEANSLAHDVRFLSFTVHDPPVKEPVDKALGWGPREVKPGDAAVVVHGFNLPMIVRKLLDNTYRFMGPCYVHGFMDGEAFDVAGLGDEETIVV